MSSGLKKVVVDTNVLLSAAIYPNSPSAQALTTAFAFCAIFHSKETLCEITTVLNRSKFDCYFLDAEFTRDMFLEAYIDKSIKAEVTQISSDCEDPKDNMFCLWPCHECRLDCVWRHQASDSHAPLQRDKHFVA